MTYFFLQCILQYRIVIPRLHWLYYMYSVSALIPSISAVNEICNTHQKSDNYHSTQYMGITKTTSYTY